MTQTVQSFKHIQEFSEEPLVMFKTNFKHITIALSLIHI